MIANGKELYTFLDSIFIAQGYVRKKDTYYKHTEECICYFTIGKSHFKGSQYENAMGGFFKPIYEGQEEFPPYHKDHLRYNLGFFVGKEMAKRVFNLENNEFKGNERELLIKELIELYAIPFLEDISSKNGIIKAIDKYGKLKYFTKRPLVLALGITANW